MGMMIEFARPDGGKTTGYLATAGQVRPGIVVIQTINPEHYAIRYASEQNYSGFYAKELQFRKAMRYPPFAALANVLVRSQKQEEALAMSTDLGRLLDPAPDGVRVLGPAEESKYLSRHVEDLRAGRFVIMVLAPEPEKRKLAARILNAHDGEFVGFYGPWSWQSLDAVDGSS